VLVSEIYTPKTVEEAITVLSRYPDALIFAGGTDYLRDQADVEISFPREVLSVAGIPELRQVNLTERFLEIGAAVTLSEILELKENAVPSLLSDALRGVASPAIRNLATIGGNLASGSRFMDSWAVLACLDTLVEARDELGARWINVNRLVSPEGKPAIPKASLLTRIRIPIDPWDISAFKKIGPKNYPCPESAAFAFAARADKGIVSDFRLAFAGERALRLREIESRLLGMRLPLSQKDRKQIQSQYRATEDPLSPGLRLQFNALIDGALDLLSR